MNPLRQALRGAGLEERALSGTLANPPSWLVDAFAGGSRSYSGRTVTVEGSLALVPVYAAVSRLAGTVGALPLPVYKRIADGGRERATSNRAWRLLHDQPNPEMAADELWELVEAHLLLWGNAFVAKVRDSLGIVRELWPIRPNRVLVGRDEQGRFFLIDSDGTKWRETDILHIRGLGTDGLVGLSPIQQARHMLAAGMEMQEFTGQFWANGAYPGGVLQHPNRLSDDAARRLKATWQAAHGGSNKGRVAILEEGMRWEATGMPLEDAQFIETKQFTHLEIALLFQIPPHWLGAKSGDSLKYSTTELEGIDFLTYSLRRWLVRIENSLKRDASIIPQPKTFYPEFLVDALLRSSTRDRYESYAIALDPARGWMQRSEVRERENLPPEEDPPAPPAETSPEPPSPNPGDAA